MRKRREQFAAQVAIDFYKHWIESENIVKESDYGSFWSEYWKKNRKNFLDPEFYYTFFDWERWQTREFYGHNNPFTIDFSLGNKQAFHKLIETINQIYNYTGWDRKSGKIGYSNIIFEKMLEILEYMPKELPGEPD